MQIIIVDNYQEMSARGAQIIKEFVEQKRQCVLGLATGGTPVGLYGELAKQHRQGLDFSGVTTFNLDEYIGLDALHPASYRFFMEQHLFSQINVCPENIHIPNGKAEDMHKECSDYERTIREHGGIDLQLLGIGRNGHIGFNEPGTEFGMETHIIKLTEDTRQANARFFASIAEVPTMAVSMGIKSIMKAKKILLLANGADKAEAVAKAVRGPVCKELPASILQLHPDISLVLDKDSAALLDKFTLIEKGE